MDESGTWESYDFSSYHMDSGRKQTGVTKDGRNLLKTGNDKTDNAKKKKGEWKL